MSSPKRAARPLASKPAAHKSAAHKPVAHKPAAKSAAKARPAPLRAVKPAAAAANGVSAEAERLAAALEQSIVDDKLDTISAPALQKLIAAASRLYRARREAGEDFW